MLILNTQSETTVSIRDLAPPGNRDVESNLPAPALESSNDEVRAVEPPSQPVITPEEVTPAVHGQSPELTVRRSERFRRAPDRLQL